MNQSQLCVYMYTHIYRLFLRETFLSLHAFTVCNSFSCTQGEGLGNLVAARCAPRGGQAELLRAGLAPRGPGRPVCIKGGAESAWGPAGYAGRSPFPPRGTPAEHCLLAPRVVVRMK